MIRLRKLGYFTATEAAEYIGIKRQKFYEFRDKGLLPPPFLIQDGMTIWKKMDIDKVKKTLGITTKGDK